MEAGAEDGPDAWMQWRFNSATALAGEPGTLAFTRYEFARHEALALAKAAAPGRPIEAFQPTAGPVSRRTVMFVTADDSTLLVVVGAHEPEQQVGLALPYALEQVGDRDLTLIVPAHTEWPLLARLPWLDQHTRLYAHDGSAETVQEKRVPLRSEVLQRVIAPPAAGAYQLSPTQDAGGGEGDEISHVRHRFQARLLALDPPDRLGLDVLLPEFPAFRPRYDGQTRSFIDFLGVDGDGRLHVVETEVGASEPTAALQALDDWVWVEANRHELAAELGADPDKNHGVHLIVLPGRDGEVLMRHNRYVIERLSRAVPLQVWAARGDLDGALTLDPVHFARIRSGDTWPSRIRRRVIAAASLPASHTPDPLVPLAGLSPASGPAAETLLESGKLHGYVHLAQSSQRFALDLFGSLDAERTALLLKSRFGPLATCEPPAFEWSDPEDVLAESTPARPNRTQVDVMLRGETVDGRDVALLVEVKLSENAFGHCSHAEIAPPDARGACTQPGPFGGAPETCWQLRNRDLGQRRTYDEYLEVRPAGEVDVGPGCWFRELNQPMRNAALAQMLMRTGRYDECRAALTVPAGHVSMRRRWAEAASMFPEGLLTLLDPEEVLGALGTAERTFLVDRYGLGPPR